MKGFIGLTKRNLLIYFKDVQTVIFSLLTSIIVFMLYLLFLKGNYVDSIKSVMEGLEGLVSDESVEMVVDGFLLTGILGSAMITVSFNCLQTIVKDRENKIDYDISATPLKRWQIILSYFVSSTLSAIIMTGVILTVGLWILHGMGDPHISSQMILAAYGIVVLGSISATAFFMILMQFFKSTSASGAFFGMLSAAAGFVIGAYMPISQFSEAIQTFCNLVPATHATVLMRNALLNGLLDHVDKGIGGVDNGVFVDSMREIFSFKAVMFGENVGMSQSVLYVGIATLVCIVGMVIVYNKTYKRK